VGVEVDMADTTSCNGGRCVARVATEKQK